MRDYIDIALRYGGFTALDSQYLKGRLQGLSDAEKLACITPPPSVLNAYFAELYQKKSPQAATDYFLGLSTELGLFQTDPSFEREEKPFVRLNLSGKSFGFCYMDASGRALVFSEKNEQADSNLLFEIAQIFQHYLVFLEKDKIYMRPRPECLEAFVLQKSDYLLTDLFENTQWIQIAGPNQEEVLEIAQHYPNRPYYAFKDRTAIVYIKKGLDHSEG